MEKVKVLITGPVNGAIQDLTLKLTSLQKSKAGPFDMCFCVGPFFSSLEKHCEEIQLLLKCNLNDGDDTESKSKNLDKARNHDHGDDSSGDDKLGFPLPVYFCDVGTLPKGVTLPTMNEPAAPSQDDAEISIEDMESVASPATKDGGKDKNESENAKLPKGIVNLAPNLYHLHGISLDQTQTADILNIATVQNPENYITVAFFPPNARMGSIQSAKLESKTNHPSYVGCDLLLTSDWGQGMASSSCISHQDKVNLGLSKDGGMDGDGHDGVAFQIGSYDVAEVASQCRPRYHVAPSLVSRPPSLLKNGEPSDQLMESYFLQSLPYINPPSSLASGILKNYHTSRFLALCPVVDAETQKRNGKAKKYIHALGIQPLWSMDRETATAVPENTVIAPCPYTDECYLKDGNGQFSTRGANSVHVGLSEAQTRRILSEQGAGSIGGMQDYRWNMGKRKRVHDDSQLESTSMDSNNCTLFLHGLHNDVTGGATLNREALLNAFRSKGCVRVRYPVSDGNPSYCFLDFETHEEAKQCLEMNGGQEEIFGIALTMKWSAGKRRLGPQGGVAPLPPPPPGHVGIYSYGMSGKRPKHRLTEAEAADSSSLFVHLNCPSMTEELRASALERLGGLAQRMLEDAVNADAGDERVSADDEPALRVSMRPLHGRINCGFLDFASHAAASMTLATLTGSTDGGTLQDELASHGNELMGSLKGAQMWWARAKEKAAEKFDASHNIRFDAHHFPLDARKDCWFCLASPTCEKHLIVSVFDKCYITMPKGPVSKNHVLIVPVNHSANEDENNRSKIGAFLDPSPGVIADLEKAKEKLRTYARDELNMDLFVFERAFPTRGGYHAHINCIPIEKGLGSKVIATMLNLASSRNHGNGFELRELQNPDFSVTNILKNADEENLLGYFYAEVSLTEGNLKRYLYMALDQGHVKDSRKQVSLQFGREVLATVLGNEDIADWKRCVMSKELEEEYTQAFRSSFSKYE